MDILTPAHVLLGLIALVAWLVGRPSTEAVRRAEAEMSADDVAAFRDRYLSARSRADMPTRFADLAQARDRASRIWVITAVSVVLALVWIITAGPSLGLDSTE